MQPTNLCEFIRKFIAATALYIVIITLAVTLATILLYPVAYPFIEESEAYIMVFIVGILIDGGLLIGALREYTTPKKNTWYNYDINITIPDTGFLTLVYKYISAVHDKTCPLIRYK